MVTVTPTPSTTSSQLLQTPVGTVSLFGFKTPVPYPFGAERTGYLVNDLDGAIISAKSAGADVLVACRSEFVTADASGGVGVLPPNGSGICRVGVDISAELSRQVGD